MGMSAIQWDVDSLDWKGISASDISGRVLKKREKRQHSPFFHNAAENTPEALPGIIEGLIADGYKIVPVSQILSDRRLYYRQHRHAVPGKGRLRRKADA